MMQCEKQLHQDRDYLDLRNSAAGRNIDHQALPLCLRTKPPSQLTRLRYSRSKENVNRHLHNTP
jgi:hypothetical protein